MTESDFRSVEADEERRLLRSWGFWDVVALGALVGAGIGFLHGLGDGAQARAVNVFAGMGIGALCAVSIGFARAKMRARQRCFALWAHERGWSYQPAGIPFGDTPLLRSGDRRIASDFFSDFWPLPGAVLYQHRRIVGSGRSQQTFTYLVLHFQLAEPATDELLIWPRKHGMLFGDANASVDEIDLESTELMQRYRVGCLHGRREQTMTLLQPTLIVRLLDFQRGFLDTNSYFELQGRAVAFMLEKAVSPKQPELLERSLALWKPVVDWLVEKFGAPPETQSIYAGAETTELPF